MKKYEIIDKLNGGKRTQLCESLNVATNLLKLCADKNRYEIWFQIEVLVCETLYIDKKISKKDFLQIKKKGKVDVEDIQKLDRETHHEVIAFLNSISKKIRKSARHIHHGITSSDIIDTAFSIQLKQS